MKNQPEPKPIELSVKEYTSKIRRFLDKHDRSKITKELENQIINYLRIKKQDPSLEYIKGSLTFEYFPDRNGQYGYELFYRSFIGVVCEFIDIEEYNKFSALMKSEEVSSTVEKVYSLNNVLDMNSIVTSAPVDFFLLNQGFEPVPADFMISECIENEKDFNCCIYGNTALTQTIHLQGYKLHIFVYNQGIFLQYTCKGNTLFVLHELFDFYDNTDFETIKKKLTVWIQDWFQLGTDVTRVNSEGKEFLLLFS